MQFSQHFTEDNRQAVPVFCNLPDGTRQRTLKAPCDTLQAGLDYVKVQLSPAGQPCLWALMPVKRTNLASLADYHPHWRLFLEFRPEKICTEPV
jgi:hypothetical protein